MEQLNCLDKIRFSEYPLDDLRGDLGRVSTAGRWRPQRFLVDRRGLHLSSSRRTSSSAPCAQGRINPNTTAVTWSGQHTSYKKADLMIMGTLMRIETYLKLWLVSRSPDHLWPDIWSRMSKASQRKEWQQWAFEKAKLDNARKLRGIYSIDLEDVECKETMKTRGKIVRITRAGKPAANPTLADQSMHASLKLTNLREPEDHEDRIVEKGFNPINHKKLVRKFIPMPQAMNIVDAKAALDKELEKLENLPAWRLSKVKSKKDVILEAQKERNEVHFATLMVRIHYNITIWFTNLFLCPKLWKFLQWKQQWTRSGKIGEIFGVELDESQK